MKLYKATSILASILVFALVPVSIGASNELETDFPIKCIEETKAGKINSISNDEVECYNETTVENKLVSVNKVFAMNSIIPKIMSYDNTDVIETQVATDNDEIKEEESVEVKEVAVLGSNDMEEKEKENETSNDSYSSVSEEETDSRETENVETNDVSEEIVKEKIEDDKIASKNKEEEEEEDSDEANEDYSETAYVSSSKAEILSHTDSDAEVIDTVDYKEEVIYQKIDNDWVAVETESGDTGYIQAEDLEEETTSTERVVPISGDKRKSYESYKALTNKKSKQYQLQQVATTGEDGGRMIDGRYLVATGSGISHEIGKCIDVKLANGKVIPCVIGDAKQNCHTNANNTIGLDGGAIEFIVDQSTIDKEVKKQGNMELANEGWDSKVVSVEILDKSY